MQTASLTVDLEFTMIRMQHALAFAVLLLIATLASAQPTTVIVSPVTGNPGASGTNLINALAGITTASSSNPYVLKLDPGIYDVGAAGLQMKPYVDIEGSGQQSTIVRGIGGSFGVVNGAAPAELRNLQVLSQGGALVSNSVAVYLDECATSLRDLTLISGGGHTQNIGLYAYASGTTVSNVSVTATGGLQSFGMSFSEDNAVIRRAVVNATGATLNNWGLIINPSINGSIKEVRDVEINVGGGSSNYGIFITPLDNTPATVEIDNSTISAQADHTNATGIIQTAYNVAVVLSHTSVKAFHGYFGGGASYGFYSLNGTGTFYAEQSVISGLTQSIYAPSKPAYVGASRLSGTLSVSSAHCAASYNVNWVALGAGCV